MPYIRSTCASLRAASSGPGARAEAGVEPGRVASHARNQPLNANKHVVQSMAVTTSLLVMCNDTGPCFGFGDLGIGSINADIDGT